MIDPDQSYDGDWPAPEAGSAHADDPMERPSVWPRHREGRQPTPEAARKASRSGPVPRVIPSGRNVEPLHVIADLTAPAVSPPTDRTLHSADNEPAAGSLWDESTQGWVRTKDGSARWRTILTTADVVARYTVGTHLGLTTGEAAVTVHGDDTRYLGGTLLRARRIAVDGMSRQAVGRGAHAVIGISIAYTPFAGNLLVTATGTAVTLMLPTDPQYDR